LTLHQRLRYSALVSVTIRDAASAPQTSSSHFALSRWDITPYSSYDPAQQRIDSYDHVTVCCYGLNSTRRLPSSLQTGRKEIRRTADNQKELDHTAERSQYFDFHEAP
jgi:hypothetical protein